jgi:uncharacterized membrane protein YgcG
MISLVIGSPGCKEGISSLSPPTEIVAKQILQYGYGHISIYNSTHLHWEWEQTGTASARRQAAAEAAGIESNSRVLLRGSKIVADAPFEAPLYETPGEATTTPKKKSGSRSGSGTTKKKSGSGAKKGGSSSGSSGTVLPGAAPIEDQFWLIK